MAKVPTVRVADDAAPGGYVLINEADYDPDEHTLWEERGDEEPAEEDQGGGDAYICGAELASGKECSREVDAEDARCWQHEE